MKNRDLLIDSMGKVASRHIEKHINRVQPTGIRKYLVYPFSAAIYVVACLVVLAIIPLIVINLPKETPGKDPGTQTVEVAPTTTLETTESTALQESETATSETTEESITTEVSTEPAPTETTPAPTETTTPAPVLPPEPTVHISDQIMLSPTSAMRTVNGLEFKITVTENGRESNDKFLKDYLKNSVGVELTLENKGSETVYVCRYYDGMFPVGAAMYADGEPADDYLADYATYGVVEDFDPLSGKIVCSDPSTYNPSYAMKPGDSIQPPVGGYMYNGGDSTIGKNLEIRATLAVFLNPSENLKNGIFTKEDIEDLEIVEIVIPWNRDTVVG